MIFSERMCETKCYILFFCVAFVFVTGLLSCSLNYSSDRTAPTNDSPELTFNTASFCHYIDNTVVFALEAPEMELYNVKDVTWARDAVFYTFDANQDIESEGRCNLLGITENGEVLTLFSDVTLTNKKDGMNIKTDALKWDSWLEKASSTTTDATKISHNSFSVSGYGFIADRSTGEYKFLSSVFGTISSENENGD